MILKAAGENQQLRMSPSCSQATSKLRQANVTQPWCWRKNCESKTLYLAKLCFRDKKQRHSQVNKSWEGLPTTNTPLQEMLEGIFQVDTKQKKKETSTCIELTDLKNKYPVHAKLCSITDMRQKPVIQNLKAKIK